MKRLLRVSPAGFSVSNKKKFYCCNIFLLRGDMLSSNNQSTKKIQIPHYFCLFAHVCHKFCSIALPVACVCSRISSLGVNEGPHYISKGLFVIHLGDDYNGVYTFRALINLQICLRAKHTFIRELVLLIGSLICWQMWISSR